MPALMPPRLEVVADRRAVHAVRFGGDRQLDEFPRRELFRRRLISEFEFSHAVRFYSTAARDPSTGEAGRRYARRSQRPARRACDRPMLRLCGHGTGAERRHRDRAPRPGRGGQLDCWSPTTAGSC